MTMAPLHHAVVADLRTAYDSGAEARSLAAREPWKLREREGFLNRLRREEKRSLFEVGAGAGQDSEYFAANGLAVVAIDLSPRMVAMCRNRGIEAHVMDVLQLDLPADTYDAAYSMNSILHISDSDLAEALAAIRRPLKAGSLFYLGVYGGRESFEGILASDNHVPPRFFSFRTDSQLLAGIGPNFRVEDFHVVEDGDHFQSLTLRAIS